MNCPHCGQDTNGKTAGFCPHCGAFLGLSQPSDAERIGTTDDQARTSPVVAQQQTPAPVFRTQSPGPLLTGRIALDAAIGFLGEVVAFALLVYGSWQLFRLLNGGSATLLSVVGTLATACFVFWYTKTMRKRYPTFAQGWQKGRTTWGIGIEHMVTLLFGVMMLVVLFPLGGLLICIGIQFGPLAWVAALAIAYLFGILARRMTDSNKKSQGPRL